MTREKIAVVGGGIAGITSALLLSKAHEVTLFEASDRLGGHAHPVRVKEGDREFYIDTAFLIFNSHSYKNFIRFLGVLGLSNAICNSDMSIGISDSVHQLTYAVNAGLRELFHQKRNLFSPKFFRLIREIKRFRELAGRDYIQGSSAGLSLGEYLKRQGFSELFMEAFAYPLGASVWSLPGGAMADFPADLFFYFFSNHKILKSEQGATWQTMKGSSHLYLQKFEESTSAKIVKKCPVASIDRTEGQVSLNFTDGRAQSFDRVVLATHADAALRLLKQPNAAEKDLLGEWTYQDSQVILHTDSSIFPRINHSWPSWNIRRFEGEKSDDFVITYYLNRIQRLDCQRNYFVSLHGAPIRKEEILEEYPCRHPVFTVGALATQKKLSTLNKDRTFFCGSYFGNGFHEDSINSALTVAGHFGLGLEDVAKL